jgi:CBS domain-containing protein
MQGDLCQPHGLESILCEISTLNIPQWRSFFYARVLVVPGVWPLTWIKEGRPGSGYKLDTCCEGKIAIMKAKDVMTHGVLTVGPGAPVNEIARLLLERHISAVPVVDTANRILGIVSEGDLMRRPETGTARRLSWWLRIIADRDTLAREYTKTHGLEAQSIMTRDVVAVNEDTDLADIAQILEKRRIKRVPVVRDGRLVGIVSRANLIQGLAVKRGAIGAEMKVDDDRIRREFLQALQEQPWASRGTLNVVVDNGVVHLYGLVASDAEREALVVAAKEVKAVRAVEDHLHLRDMYADAT